MSDVMQKQNTSDLGFRGHFALSGLLDVAQRFGLEIEPFNGIYKVTPAEGQNLDDLCPSYISHDKSEFDRKNLRALLEFLHQPVHAVTQRVDKKNESLRIFAHDYLKLTTEGQICNPNNPGGMGACKIHGEDCNGVGCDLHLDLQRDMDQDQEWRTKTEVGAKSLLPGLSFDVDKGLFKLSIAPVITAPRDADSFSNNIIQHIHDNLTQVESAPTQTTKVMYLTAQQLESYIDRAVAPETRPELAIRFAGLGMEEAAHDKIKRISQRAQSLAISNGVNDLLSHSGDHANSAERKLLQLLQTTTALTEIVDSDLLKKAWGRYHFTERKQPPSLAVAQELAILQQTLRHYTGQDYIDPITLEAITQEFYPLLAFAREFSDTLGIEDAANSIEQASLSGAHTSNASYTTDQRKVLELVHHIKGEGRPAVLRIANAGIESGKDFVLDVAHFIRESPKAAAAFALVTAVLLATNGQTDPNAAQAAKDIIMTFGDSTTALEAMKFDPSTLPEDVRNAQNYHWDIGIMGPYKHFMNSNFVVGPTQATLDFIRMASFFVYEKAGLIPNLDPSFSKSATGVVEPFSDELFKINVFQNFSHAAFWIYMVSKGYQHGFKGGGKILNLFAPLTDAMCHGATAALEKTRLRSSAHLPKKLMALAGQAQDHINNSDTTKLSSALTHAAAERASVERSFSTQTPLFSPDMKVKGLKETFRVSAENLQPTIDALKNFDVALEYISASIGVKHGWHRHELQCHIQELTEALQEFSKRGDSDKLQQTVDQHLHSIISSELRQRNKSSIYKALFNTDLDGKEKDALLRDGHAYFGQLRRSERITSHEQKKHQTSSLFKRMGSNAVIAGTASWDAMVGLARNAQKAFHAMPYKKAFAWAATGVGAASIALDMSGQSAHLFNAQVAQMADALASGTGLAAGTALTLSTFLIYNFFEDIIGVHVLSGAALHSAGAAAGKVLPSINKAALEKIEATTGLDLRHEWQKLQNRLPWTKQPQMEAPEPAF